MAPSVQLSTFSALFARANPDEEAAENSKLTPTLIAGIVVASLLAASVVVWGIFRYVRKRASAARQDDRGVAFLNVRGVMKDGDQKSGGLPMSGTQMFSKDNLTASVVMPEKAGTREQIIDQYTAEGKLPRPFAPFMTGGGRLSVSSAGDDSTAGSKRMSTASWISMGRNSIFGGKSSNRASTASFASTVSTVKSHDKRKIRQTFTPVLPDELVISLGEQLTVVNSFDDGWCIVGRDSMFKPGEVELGAIPAWCFMKPVQGLRAERPMRTASLGVTVTLDAEPGTRDEVMSWSNF